MTLKLMQDKQEKAEAAAAEVIQETAAVTVPQTRSAPNKIQAKQVAAPSAEATKDANVKQ
jgi:hypothetical protein